MNRNLYNNTYKIPENVMKHLWEISQTIKDGETTDGVRRNADLIKKGEVTYPVLKRIKNFFDTNNKGNQDRAFILNGGDVMKNWVNQTLASDRGNDELSKKIKSDGGVSNAHIKPHEKNNLNSINRPTMAHKKTSEKYDTAVTESLKRINELMNKII
jgi:hypothetical protein